MRAPVVPIAVGIGVRVALIVAAYARQGAAAFLASDSFLYLDLAGSIASRAAFERLSGVPEIFRVPGYPLVLAAGVRFGHPVAFALLLQLALCVISILLVASIVQALSGPVAARRAAFAVALEPTLLLWSIKVMPEMLMTTCVLVSAAAAVWYLLKPETTWPVLAAVGLAAAAYAKPIAYPVALAACGCAVVSALIARETQAHRRHAVIFVTVVALLLGTWHVRNGWRTGYWGFSTIGELALHISVAGSIEAHDESRSYYDVRRARIADAERMGYGAMRRDGIAAIAGSPVLYARIHAAGVLRTLFDPGTVEYFRLLGAYVPAGGLLGRAVDQGLPGAVEYLVRERPWLALTSAAMVLLTWPFVLLSIAAGFFLPDERRRRAYILFALVAWLLLLLGGGAPGYSRFRTPAVPLLIVTIACGSAATARNRRVAAV